MDYLFSCTLCGPDTLSTSAYNLYIADYLVAKILYALTLGGLTSTLTDHHISAISNTKSIYDAKLLVYSQQG